MAPPNRLQALLELSRALSSSLDLDEVLLEMLSRVARLTGATGTAVWRWDREPGVMVTLVHHSHGTNSLVEDGVEGYVLEQYPATAECSRRSARDRSAARIRSMTRPSVRCCAGWASVRF